MEVQGNFPDSQNWECQEIASMGRTSESVSFLASLENGDGAVSPTVGDRAQIVFAYKIT